MKSTLTDFLDLSECSLSSQNVIDCVSRARRHHKIKGLKLSSNNLDSNSFEKLLECIKGVTNLNLANNQLNNSVLDIILKNK